MIDTNILPNNNSKKINLKKLNIKNLIYKFLIPIIAVFLLIGYFSIGYKGYIEYRYNQSDQPEHIRNTILKVPIISSDGAGYYSYLPHYLIDKEIAEGKKFGFSNPLVKEPILIKYNCGVAVMTLPYFITAHIISKLAGLPTDGYSKYYQILCGLAGLFYSLLGILIIKKILEKYFNKKIIIFAILTILFGTNLYHFSTFDSDYSHAFSFFLFSAILYLTPKFYENPKKYKYSILLGISAGMIPLIRTSNAIFLIIIPLYGIISLKDIKNRVLFILKNYKSVIIILVFMFIVFLPQMLIWYQATGKFFINSYAEEAFKEENPYWYMGFNFLSPKIFPILFSLRKGLFFWSPILIFSVLGVWFLRRKAKEYFIPAIIYLPIITYINASWWVWDFGGGFSHRAFTESLSIMTISLAAFFAVLTKKISKITISVLSFIFVIYSIFMMIFYWKGVIPLGGASLITFMDIFKISKEQITGIYNNLKFTNYAVIVPIILILITIGFCILLVFKKNKLIYFILIFFIFLDLMSVGRFQDGVTNASAIYKNKEISEKFSFLKKDTTAFRILPVYPALGGYIIGNNNNLFYELYSITGLTPLVLKDYFEITGLKESSEHINNLKMLLKNNNIISMLNVRYIIVPYPDKKIEFFNDITKILKIKDINIISKKSLEKAEAKNIEIKIYNDYKNYNNSLSHNNVKNDTDIDYDVSIDNIENVISFNSKQNNLKILSIPVNIKPQKNYLVEFEIKIASQIDNIINFDFFGNGYDNAEQEFILKPEMVKNNFTKIQKTLNSGNIPKNTNTNFRIFSTAIGNIEIKNLKIFEIQLKNYYKEIYSDKEVLVLENQRFLPRFYFPSKIISVDNTKQAKKILWDYIEENEIAVNKNNEFNVKNIALVESIDFSQNNFNNQNINYKVLRYNNNYVAIEIKNNEDAFMVFSDNYYPGWKAYINGKEVKIYKTNGILKGIYLNKGNNIVVFKYRPSYFKISLLISLVSFLAIIMTSSYLFFKNRKLKT